MEVLVLEPDVPSVLATLPLVRNALIEFGIVRLWAYPGSARPAAAGAWPAALGVGKPLW